jgi:hypothetical protein
MKAGLCDHSSFEILLCPLNPTKGVSVIEGHGRRLRVQEVELLKDTIYAPRLINVII